MSRVFTRTFKAIFKRNSGYFKRELKDLKAWVKSGHSPYENGDYICLEGGGPMDFINALRFQEDLKPGDYDI